jgi:endonuclease-3
MNRAPAGRPAAPLTLRRILNPLARHYGPPPRPFPTSPFQQVLWENVAYLADDIRRMQAFDTLKRDVGLDPEAILHASADRLRRATSFGILADKFAAKLHDVARIALEEFDGHVDAVVDLPLPQAKRALRRFPGIGEPGAEKILLFSGRQALLAPDSNALRVLQRLGFVPERKSYATSYAAARKFATDELGADTGTMLRAHQLLRRHGQDLCTRSAPACPRCPLRTTCPRVGVAS